MPRITLIATAALATLALAAPGATAMVDRDGIGTTAPPQLCSRPSTCAQDLRGADARDASVMPQTGMATPTQDFRTADARDAGAKPVEPVPGLPTWATDPKPIAPARVNAAPVADDDDTSPFLYIIPGIALGLLLTAGLGYAVRTSGRTRRARISA